MGFDESLKETMRTFFQKNRFSFLAGAFYLIIAVPSAFANTAHINDTSGTPTCPFPHNVRYAYGLQPSRYTQAQYAAAVSQFYTTWCSTFVTGTGSSTRVWWPDGSSAYMTVSEGIGYGMLIAVQMADKTLFDGLDGYRKAHLDGNNLMNWTCAGPTGATCTGNAATDADQDMCLALYMAANQWSSATYTTEANTVATGLMNTCFPNSRVTGGDANTGVIYPDYCAPGWYRCFATKTGNTAWTNVVTWVYSTFCPALESQWTHGLVPNEINNDGTFHSCIALGSEGCNNHGYDSSRWGWRMGTDYLWNGQNQGPISMFAYTMQAGVTANGYLNYIQEYFNATDGKTATKAGTDGSTSPCSHLQIGPALVGCMAGLPNNPVNQAFVDDTYDELARRLMANTGCVTLEYFQDTLGLMCLMVGTGNFPNMACNGCAAGTPPSTPTPMPCFMLDDLEDDNLINSTNGFWFTFSYASLNNTPVNPTPTRALVSNANYILQSPGANGTNWAAAVTGFWMDNGLASPATYGGFAIATQLNAPWNNLLNVTVGGAGPCSLVDMTFYTKATAPMTVRVNFYNPAIDPSNGGDANQFGYTIPVTTTWQAVTITYNEIMCQDWAGTGVCTGGISGGGSLTRSQALTNVTSVQWDTAGNPATVGYWVDQVCMHFAKISNGYYTPVVLNTATPSAVAGTPTGTPTSSATRTSTSTPSATPTNTVANTSTSTPTLTPTATLSPTRTSSPTNTVANTATSTPTSTPTSSLTSTATSSPTRTASATPSATPTNTLASTATNTGTSTASRTPTTTPTATPTNTLASTATYTGTSTVTNTVTLTPTSSATRTPTSTASATATNTLANTATNTVTSTATSTPTSTATRTATSTVTNTNTITQTYTPSPTGQATDTNTPTSTASGTSTLTATQTATATTTNSATLTVTRTSTSTASATATNTLANTATHTATLTPTNTGASTATQTPSLTPTNTLINTATSTATRTATSTATLTASLTPSATPTNTLVSTATSTPTQVTVAASQGVNPPANSSQLPGSSGVTVQQVALSNPSSTVVNVTAVTLTVSGSGNVSDITGVTLWINGTAITTTTFTGNTAVYLISSPIPPTSSVTFLVTASFDNSASGTYNFSVSGMSATNGQPVLFSGMPVLGATVTVTQPTATATSTPTNTPTLTVTPLPSSTPTITPTSTSAATFTPTASDTSTITSTPQPNTTPVVFPNPSTGEPVTVAASFAEPVNQVNVQIFTTAFRKVQDNTVNSTTSGVTASAVSGTPASNWRIPVQMQDNWGNPLASGLYYVVITANGHQRSVVKLLLLR